MSNQKQTDDGCFNGFLFIVAIVGIVGGGLLLANSESLGYLVGAVLLAIGVAALLWVVAIIGKSTSDHAIVAGFLIVLAIVLGGFKSCTKGLNEESKRPNYRRHHRRHYYSYNETSTIKFNDVVVDSNKLLAYGE